MNFNLNQTIEILERTPDVIHSLLAGLSDEWTSNNEGQNTWSSNDILGHLIHGEKTDWIPRLKIIMSENSDKSFPPFDRFAQLLEPLKTIAQLLDEFSKLRRLNLHYLRSINLTEIDFMKTGIHPEFGEVTVAQLLSTWAVHDLNHLAQISRVMAKQYQSEVGPWKAYLKILSI